MYFYFYFYCSGTIERRWISFELNGKCEAMLAIRAVGLKSKEKFMLCANPKDIADLIDKTHVEWNIMKEKCGELEARDIILQSICPEVFGLFPVKLAIALAICSCNNSVTTEDNGMGHQRKQTHVLIVGDPGVAKSKLLVHAAQIAPWAVYTTGSGVSVAGLTASVVE